MGVNGPMWLASETATSSNARERIFELVVAACLKAADFAPRFLPPTDIVVDIAEATFFVECKRIASESGLRGNLRKDSRQLKTRFEEQHDERRYGIIAIEVSKAINPRGFRTSSESLRTK